MNKEEKILEEHGKWFADEFIAEVDSWFSADIACCDNCVDSFLEYWPLANEADDCAFQKSYIDMDTFYSGSRLQDSYTKEEFDVLIKTIHCERCGAPLEYGMYPYDLPFLGDIDTIDFECRIEELTAFSMITPFLLLKNSFASEIHDVLHELFLDTKPTKIEQSLYRARISTQVDNLCFSKFTVAPKEVIGEGRYNHSAEQVLYLASDKSTCYHEVGKQLCYVAECQIMEEIKVLDLTEPYKAHQKHESILNALIFSALMSKKISTKGYNKPAYIFSRFIADCAKSANFDAIKYPSTKEINNNYNLVILNEKVFTSNIQFTSVCLFDGNKETDLGITV